MKTLFTVTGKSLWLAKSEELVFCVDKERYYDAHGKQIAKTDVSFRDTCADQCNKRMNSENTQEAHLEDEEELVAESITEPLVEIDDMFGCYGFQNRMGEFVIEPQYAYAYDFTCGLAAVNLNRTWYTSHRGWKMYENHYGYIDKNGKTVIPFQYDHAWPFNKYGVAVVKDQFGSYLIDLDGKTIPGLDRYNFSHYYDYEERFIEITFREDQSDEPLTGAYDTKLRHVLLQPSVESIECEDDEIIRVYEYTDEECSEDIPQYFLNWKGERVYDWVTGNGFSHIDKPNINGVSIVSMRKYTELPENAVSYILHNGKKCSVKKQYGLFNSKKEFILPIGWDYIVELTDTIYACSKNGVYTIIEIESSDC